MSKPKKVIKAKVDTNNKKKVAKKILKPKIMRSNKNKNKENIENLENTPQPCRSFETP